MTLVLIVAVLAAALALCLGGRPRRLLGVRLRQPRLLATAAGLLLAGYLGSLAWQPAWAVGYLLAALVVAWFCWRNLALPGLLLVGLGLLANALVLLLNGAQPVALDAANAAGVDQPARVVAQSPRLEPASSGTLLPWLGDVVPLAWPVAPQVVSPGDVLAGAGLGLALFCALTGQSGTPRRRCAPTLEAAEPDPDVSAAPEPSEPAPAR